MSVFVTIIETGSLSAAGRRLQVPLATVSRKLSDLETHLKTRLIRRSTRRLVLTDAGRDYLAACQQILEQIDEAKRAASGAYANAKGELVISAPTTFGRMHLVPVVAAFLEAYPEVDVRLVLVDRLVKLLEEHVDVALRIGELADSNLIATRLGSIARVVCASPGYLARFGTPRTSADLEAHRCVTFEGSTSATGWQFKGLRGPKSISLHSRLTVTTAEAAIAAAIAGWGVTRVLSYQIADALQAGRHLAALGPRNAHLSERGGHSVSAADRA